MHFDLLMKIDKIGVLLFLVEFDVNDTQYVYFKK